MNILKYSTTIYITLIIALLIIFFNITNLIEQNKETIQKNNFKRFEKAVWENQPQNQINNQRQKQNIITGLSISDNQLSSNNEYPLLSLLRYYAIVLSLLTGIVVITINIFQGRKNE